MKGSLSIILVFVHLTCLAQRKTTLVGHSDCFNAYELTDTLNGPYITYGGKGKILEFSNNDKKDSLFVEKETNTIWFKFDLKEDCELTFDIIPEDINQDLDFMLYKIDGGNYCDQIINKEILPIRANISRNNKSINSWTGCSREASKYFVHSGPGDDYCSSVQASKNDHFLLLIDAPNEKIKGVKIRLPACIKKEIPGEAILKLINADTKDPVFADVRIELPDFDNIAKDSIDQVGFPLLTPVKGKIKVSAKGILPYNGEVEFKPKEERLIELEPIKVGSSLRVTDIHFVGDKAEYLPKSIPVLEEIRDFMLQNPGVIIEIQGHVNNPDKENSNFDQNLSEKRAEAVYLYLIENGVQEFRMTHKGFGNTQMINPHFPLSPEEMAANRRVEIFVVEIR